MVLGIIFITIGIFAPGRTVAVAGEEAKPWRFPSLAGIRAAMDAADSSAVVAPMPEAPFVPEVVAPPAIAWPLAIDAGATGLERTERLRLIESFTFVPGPWAAEILVQAYAEETDDLREAAIMAIAECGALAEPVLAQAILAANASERALGVDGYAKIGALEAVIPLLDDPSLPVAISAAYALARAERTDVIDAHFAADSDAPRLDEIRSVLAALA